MKEAPTAETVGYGFAFARSLALAQSARQKGNWFAPDCLDLCFDEMPNHGYCECGGFSVSDVYHYSARSDGMWHTRYECNPLPRQTP